VPAVLRCGAGPASPQSCGFRKESKRPLLEEEKGWEVERTTPLMISSLKDTSRLAAYHGSRAFLKPYQQLQSISLCDAEIRYLAPERIAHRALDPQACKRSCNTLRCPLSQQYPKPTCNVTIAYMQAWQKSILSVFS